MTAPPASFLSPRGVLSRPLCDIEDRSGELLKWHREVFGDQTSTGETAECDDLILNEVLGAASIDNRYCIFSATKPFVAATLWTLLADQDIGLDRVLLALPPIGPTRL